VTQYFPPLLGGAASRNRNIYLQFKKLGLNCKVITFRPLIKHGKIPQNKMRDIFLFTCYSFLSFFITSITVSYDILLLSSPPITIGPLALFGRFLRKIVLIDVQDIWPESLVEEGYLKKNSPVYVMLSLCENIAYKYADRIITVSPYLADQIRRKTKKDVFVLMSGTDPNFFRPKIADPSLKAKLGLEGKKVILYSGNIGKAQSIDNFLFALKEVVKEYPDVIFLIVGSGRELDSLIELHHRLKLENHVKFLPPVPQPVLVDLIALSDICIVPLHEYERGALPTKFFEYLSCGKPIIATSSLEIGRILSDSRAGIFISDPRNISLLTKSLLKLLTDDELRVKMGENGRQYSLRNFDFSKNMSRLLGDLLRLR
jgi:glycosyltransferase involved in cell wall biosynthesis